MPDPCYHRHGRPPPAPKNEIPKLLRIPFCNGFHGTICKISHPSGEAQLAGTGAGGHPKSHTLHAAGNNDSHTLKHFQPSAVPPPWEPTSSALMDLWLPSQYGDFPVRLQQQSQTSPSSSGTKCWGVMDVPACDPSQKGWLPECPQVQK